jgi:N,N'-diacetyllegionaminate synthase
MTESFVKIIAEIANVHGGDPDVALKCLDVARHHSDAVKLQVFDAAELVGQEHPDRQMIESLMFSEEEWQDIFSKLASTDIDVIVDVFGDRGLRFAQRYGADGVMIHSSDMSNLPLLREAGAFDGQVIVGVGGVTQTELERALAIISAEDTLLMYGVQSYPTALEHTFIGKIPTLRSAYEQQVGFASHAEATSSMATEIPAYAVAAGATAVEVHVAPDRDAAEYDHYSALEPDEFASMAEHVREVEVLMQGGEMGLAPHEWEYRAVHRKWPTLKHMMNRGEEIREGDVTYRRVDTLDEVPDGPIGSVIGRTVTRDLPRGTIVTEEMLR